MRRLFAMWAVISFMPILCGIPSATAAEVKYVYDTAGRLVSADYDSGAGITLIYDKNGNLLKKAVTSGSNPVPDILANLSDGPITVTSTVPVSITVGLAPGVQTGQTAEWWIVAATPFGWYSYVYPDGWVEGIIACIQLPVLRLAPLVELLNLNLPIVDYIFYFVLDNNTDGVVNGNWSDMLEVHVMQL